MTRFPEGQELITVRTRYEVRVQVRQIREELVSDGTDSGEEWQELNAEDVETTTTVFRTLDHQAAVDCGEAVKLAAEGVAGNNAFRRCDCESSHCKEKHKIAGCSGEGTVKTLYSKICEACAAHMPPAFLVPVYMNEDELAETRRRFGIKVPAKK